MRLEEFANAEDQLELWKLVTQSVITAIDTQRQQQAHEQARKQAQSKKRGASRGPSKAIPIPTPPPPRPMASHPSKKPETSKNKTVPPNFASAQNPAVSQRQQSTQAKTPIGPVGLQPLARLNNAEKPHG